MLNFKGDKFKIIIRVEVVPDGLKEPSVIQEGRAADMRFVIEGQREGTGVNFKSIGMALNEQPPVVSRMLAHVISKLPDAINQYLETPPHERIKNQRMFDRNGNDVTGTEAAKRARAVKWDA